MVRSGGAGDGSARTVLRLALSELDARLAAEAERGPGTRRRLEHPVGRPRTPASAFPRPELEERLVRHVDAGDSLARDQMARVLAGACGEEALPRPAARPGG